VVSALVLFVSIAIVAAFLVVENYIFYNGPWLVTAILVSIKLTFFGYLCYLFIRAFCRYSS
jgi:hypothetical protein